MPPPISATDSPQHSDAAMSWLWQALPPIHPASSVGPTSTFMASRQHRPVHEARTPCRLIIGGTQIGGSVVGQDPWVVFLLTLDLLDPQLLLRNQKPPGLNEHYAEPQVPDPASRPAYPT